MRDGRLQESILNPSATPHKLSCGPRVYRVSTMRLRLPYADQLASDLCDATALSRHVD